MLYRAAAANSEMPADRFNSLRARLLYIDETTAVRVAGHGVHFDSFAWQCPWDVNRPVGTVRYTVAVLAEAVDHNPINHAAPQ